MLGVYYGTDAFEAVDALLDDLKSFEALPAGSKVVIKPNLVIENRNWLGADTRPEVVEAVIRRLKDLGLDDITVADGSGVGHSAGRAFGVLGYDVIAARYGVRLLDIEEDDFIRRPTACPGPFRYLEISRTVAEADYIINIPVLKAHGETRLTCSLKNLKGVMPRGMKPKFHRVDLHRAIAQLNTTVSADFILVDGAYGDLSSEMGGTPVELGIMAAGTDPLEIDVFAAGVLGLAPSDIFHLAHYAAWRGVDLNSFTPEIHRLNKPAEEKTFTVDTDPFRRLPCTVISEGACCTCRGSLTFALKRLSEGGVLHRGQVCLNGRRGIEKIPDDDRRTLVAVGDCALRQVEKVGTDGEIITVPGCPPGTEEVVRRVTEATGTAHCKR